MHREIERDRERERKKEREKETRIHRDREIHVKATSHNSIALNGVAPAHPLGHDIAASQTGMRRGPAPHADTFSSATTTITTAAV